jgi:dipeptidyl aminopeptidase/acylaminoacyl peptidase
MKTRESRCAKQELAGIRGGHVVSVGLIMSLMAVFAASALAVEQQEYMRPPEAIARLIDVPMTPVVSVSPDREWMLLMERPGYPSIEEIAQPELRLAGMRINPRNNGPSREQYYSGLVVRGIDDDREIRISNLPDNPKIANVRWSPDSRYIAFTLAFIDRLELWVAEVAGGGAFSPTTYLVNDVGGNAYEWVSDSRTIILNAVLPQRTDPPKEVLVPFGPVVQENIGDRRPTRTYQDMLSNKHDEALFEYYATGQLVRVSIEGGSTAIGRAGIVRSFGPSPDGTMLLVQMTHPPYSYMVPMSRFPYTVQVWDLDGRLVRELADLPLAEDIPVSFGSVRTGPRSIGWRADADATLYWVEAQDGGDAGVEADIRDRVYMQAAPFDGEPVVLADLEYRYSGLSWASDDLALVASSWWRSRMQRYWRISPGNPDQGPIMMMERNWEDRYGDPGSPLSRWTDRGTSVLMTSEGGTKLFMTSSGASEEGDQPFLDIYDIASGESERLFRSEAPYYEYPIAVVEPEGPVVLTRREAVDEPPNYFLRDLGDAGLRQLTFFEHPTPELRKVTKELIRFEREDGVQLTATLYLPAGYDKETDGPLPMLMWAYPREYKSADAASQVTGSPYRFIRVGWWSPLLWLVHGYAVLDNLSMPVVGEGDEEPNDTFVEQVVANAQAAVAEVTSRGVADSDRLAIGGHSYGAFMTANVLAHSDLFRTGLARSGAYNRTLTPFGFQSEERTLWEAPEVYFAMSPFMHADKINEPILLVHGEADNNSGTYPLQSERFYEALKGHGAVARLVMLPHESHSYRAYESIMHVLWESTEWLDRYVKNAPKRQEVEPSAVGAGAN